MADALTLTRDQYEMLLDAAYSGDNAAVKTLQAEIDTANFITRHAVKVRWVDVAGKAVKPPTALTWPEQQTGTLELLVPITRAHVEEFVASRAANPTDIQVTADLNGVVGWHTLDDYDFEANAT